VVKFAPANTLPTLPLSGKTLSFMPVPRQARIETGHSELLEWIDAFLEERT